MPRKKKSASEIIELRRLKRKRKRTRRKIFIFTLIFIAICIGILFTPLFTLESVNVEGLNKIKEEEVLQKSGLTLGSNLFMFNVNNIAVSIEEIPYVDTVKVIRKIPNKFTIQIAESIPMAYVKFQNMLIPIDKYGKALEEGKPEKSYNIPILSDEEIVNYSVGEKIIANNQENFQKTLEIILNLYNNRFLEDIEFIFFKEQDIMFKLINRDIYAQVGSEEQLNSKISMIKEVANKLPNDAKGTIDIRNSEKAYFTRVE